MNRDELKAYLEMGLSSRQIAALPEVTIGSRTIIYYIHKYELTELMAYKKPVYVENFFEKITTKEAAYLLGFILCDSSIQDDSLNAAIALADQEILYYASAMFGCNVTISTRTNPETRTFPQARINVGNKQIITDVRKHLGGNLKNDRHVPRVPLEVERYLMLGIFDADGCITWGRRKDRNRIWQKISFTSSLRILEGVQKILLKIGIASVVRPKRNENCFVLEFANKLDVLKFISYLYDELPSDMFCLLRKFNRAQALRRELGEFGEVPETSSGENTELSTV